MAETERQLPGGLGRRFIPDPEDRKYPMRAVLRPRAIPQQRYYQTGRQLPLDQGNTGTCVAHAWTAFLYAALMMSRTAPSPYDTYREIVKVDEWDDNDFEATSPRIQDLQFGTSVRAGAKVMQAQGHLKNYVWSRDADEMALWLLTGQGTIVLGTTWYWDMGDLRDGGFAYPTGGVAGGHAYLAIGYSRNYKAFRCLKSWGSEFGAKGRFWIHHQDMDKLVKLEDGEACAAVQQVVLPVVV